MLNEGCRRVAPRIIEDDDRTWEIMLSNLDRWGDRNVPRDDNWPRLKGED